jgi:hypothetical protein
MEPRIFPRLDVAVLNLIEFGFLRILPFWIGFLGGCAFVVGMVSYAEFGGTLDERARWASGALEMAGTLSVAIGILDRLELYSARAFGSRVSEWLQGLEAAFVTPPTIRAVLSSTAHISVSASGRLSTEPPRTGLAERVEWLIVRTQELTKLIDDRHSVALAEIRNEAGRLSAELASLRGALHDSHEKVKTSAVGGVRLELTGICWILIGQAAGAWPSLFRHFYTP